MLDTQMLIGSNFELGAAAGEAVINPKTEEKIIDLAEASPAQVDAAVNAAEAAFKTWSRTTPAERSSLLLKLADAIDRDAESFAALEALNCGKPEFAFFRMNCRRFQTASVFSRAPFAYAWTGGGEYMAGHTSMIRRDPIGVIGSIAPWELSTDDGRMETGAGIGWRKYDRDQAIGANAANDVEVGKDDCRDFSRRRCQCHCWPWVDDWECSHQPSQGCGWFR